MTRDTNRRRSPWRRVKRTAVLLFAIIAVSISVVSCHGCAKWIAHAIVDAPNGAIAPDSPHKTSLNSNERQVVSEEFWVEVGPPQAFLSAWVIEPSPEPRTASASPQPRGTVFVLHGIRDEKRSQVKLGRAFASAGFRVVLVDLRGHGDSTGQWLTYGVVESRDLVQLLDTLNAKQPVQGGVGVIGASYGGAVGIQWASMDDRVKAVVSIATFTSLEEVVPEYLERSGFGWTVSDSTLAEGMRIAGTLAGFEPAQASPIHAIAQSNARVLLIHGQSDQHITCDHSRRLHAAAPERSRLLIVPGEDHVTIMQDRNSDVMREIISFFDDALSSSAP